MKSANLKRKEWISEHPIVEEWLGVMSDSSRQPISNILFNWFKWMEEQGRELSDLSLEELISFQKKANRANGDKRYVILDLVRGYIIKNKKWRASYKRKVYNTIRSFFMHSRAELPQDRQRMRQVLKSEVAPVRKLLEPKHLRHIVEGANRMYKAVLMSMLTGGMGMDEVVEWSNQGITQLRRALESDIYRLHGVIRIDFEPRKMNEKRFYTFLGGDGLLKVEVWLKHRERLRARFKELHPEENYSDSIFVTKNNTALNVLAIQAYWRRHVYRQGIIEVEKQPGASTRYGVNPHQIRKLFRSLWRPSGVDSEVAEFFMGHDIDKFNYDASPELDPGWFLQQYKQALPYLNILSSDRPFRKVDETEVDSLLLRVREQDEEIKILRAQVEAQERELEEKQDRKLRDASADLRAEFNVKLKGLRKEVLKELEKLEKLEIEP